MYSDFSVAYDRIMSDFNYKNAAAYLVDIAKKHGSGLNKPLDLACGSGMLTKELISLGLDPVCVDSSPDMLSIAQSRLPNGTLILCQTMQELDLNDTVDTCFCCMDSLNYITSKKDLASAFSRLSLFTDKGGLFIFDVNTEYKFRSILSDNIFTYDYDDMYLIWKSSYNSRSHHADYEITWFSEEDDGSYARADDFQRQCFWSDKILSQLLIASGFEFRAVYDAYTTNQPHEKSERLHYVWRKR